MLCKACNTRLDDGTRVCPHCGHQESYLGQSGSSSSGSRARPSTSSSSKLSPSMFGPKKKDPPQDLELRDEVETPRPGISQSTSYSARKPGQPGGTTKPGGKTSPPPSRPSPPSASKPRPSESPRPAAHAGSGRSALETVGSDLSLEPDQLLAIVCDEPELLEPGLEVYEDDAGKPLGVGFSTDVGDIDLLARSADGDWVIVCLDDETGDVMAAMLKRMGWVRKHLVKGGETVRAIVIADRVDPEVGYAAAAMADSIEFKSCRLTLRFDSISV